MLRQILEIAQEGYFLSVEKGFINLSSKGSPTKQVPLDDISALVLTARGISLTKECLIQLAKRNSTVVLCGSNFQPASLVVPVSSNYDNTGRIYEQIEASEPLKKQIWKDLIKTKIINQLKILELYNKSCTGKLSTLAKDVQSGDKNNREAQAARIYWKSLFGDSFKRDKEAGGVNAFLNYGYAILRGIVARAVCAAGLEPALGIHHKNRLNGMCLVDDLMEPYRPLFDIPAVELALKKNDSLSPENKKRIIQFAWLDLNTEKGNSPFIKSVEILVYSLIRSYQEKTNLIEIPPLPDGKILKEIIEKNVSKWV